jgi:catechol 2,3-dioxygenase-like lactoylglutathione lyase family enzyme
VKVYKISAITLSVKNMKKSCKFYSRIPGFKIVYGGSNDDTFTTFKIGEDIMMYLNLELSTNTNITTTHVDNRRNFGRIIFHTEDVDELYSHFKSDASISDIRYCPGVKTKLCGGCEGTEASTEEVKYKSTNSRGKSNK